MWTSLFKQEILSSITSELNPMYYYCNYLSIYILIYMNISGFLYTYIDFKPNQVKLENLPPVILFSLVK